MKHTKRLSIGINFCSEYLSTYLNLSD